MLFFACSFSVRINKKDDSCTWILCFNNCNNAQEIGWLGDSARERVVTMWTDQVEGEDSRAGKRRTFGDGNRITREPSTVQVKLNVRSASSLSEVSSKRKNGHLQAVS